MRIRFSAGLGHQTGASTVWKILQRSRHRPADTAVRTLLARIPPRQAHAILAADLFHVDTIRLTRLDAFFAVEHPTAKSTSSESPRTRPQPG
jgi:putative transposase